MTRFNIFGNSITESMGNSRMSQKNSTSPLRPHHLFLTGVKPTLMFCEWEALTSSFICNKRIFITSVTYLYDSLLYTYKNKYFIYTAYTYINIQYIVTHRRVFFERRKTFIFSMKKCRRVDGKILQRVFQQKKIY